MAAQLVDFTLVQVGARRQVAPRTKLSANLTLNLHWRDREQQIVEFIYDRSGANRDAWSAVGFPWILKGEPTTSRMATSATQQEWDLFQKNRVLPLPTCYGYFRKAVGGKEVEFVLMDRIAFTMYDALVSIRTLNPTPAKLEIVRKLIRAPVHKMQHLASEERVSLYDWHVMNLAFNDTLDPQVVLIDWQRNSQHSDTPRKRHMHQSFTAFCNWLDNVSEKDEKSKKAREPELYSQWQKIMTDLKKACQSWWQNLHWLPSKADLKTLDKMLLDVCEGVVFDADVPSPHAPTTTAAPSTPGVVVNAGMTLTHLPTSPAPSSIPPTSPAPSSASGTQRIATWPLTNRPPVETYEESSDEYKQIVSVLTASNGSGRFIGSGRTAAMSLGKAALEYLAHRSVEPRHGKVSKNTIFLSSRLENPDKMRKLAYDPDSGNVLGLLFRILLEKVAAHGYLNRCGEHIPNSAKKPTEISREPEREVCGNTPTALRTAAQRRAAGLLAILPVS